MYMVGAATGLDPMVAVHPLEVQEIIELSIPCCHALVPSVHDIGCSIFTVGAGPAVGVGGSVQRSL